MHDEVNKKKSHGCVAQSMGFGGDGGSRTLVQTVNQYAFYMLIFA